MSAKFTAGMGHPRSDGNPLSRLDGRFGILADRNCLIEKGDRILAFADNLSERTDRAPVSVAGRGGPAIRWRPVARAGPRYAPAARIPGRETPRHAATIASAKHCPAPTGKAAARPHTCLLDGPHREQGVEK